MINYELLSFFFSEYILPLIYSSQATGNHCITCGEYPDISCDAYDSYNLYCANYAWNSEKIL